MKLAIMIKLYIAAHGITQKELSAAIGVNESTLSRFLSGESMPDAVSFMKVIVWVTETQPAPTPNLLTRIEKLETITRNLQTIS